MNPTGIDNSRLLTRAWIEIEKLLADALPILDENVEFPWTVDFERHSTTQTAA